MFDHGHALVSLHGPLALVWAVQAMAAFAVTNFDDILLLILLFSRLDQRLRGVHVVSGQYLGLSLLVLVSLIGHLGREAVPLSWLGLLGLLPISLGISRLMDLLRPSSAPGPEPCDPLSSLPAAASWPLAGVIGVAAITVANGSDNIGVYLPLFAHAGTVNLAIILMVFAAMTGLWCLIAWRLTRLPPLASLLERFGTPLIPWVLIGLGGLVLCDSPTLHHPGLALLAVVCLGLMVLSLVRMLSSLASLDQPSLRPLPASHRSR